MQIKCIIKHRRCACIISHASPFWDSIGSCFLRRVRRSAWGLPHAEPRWGSAEGVVFACCTGYDVSAVSLKSSIAERVDIISEARQCKSDVEHGSAD
eukprot:1145815-Amphidinium_carterae.1